MGGPTATRMLLLGLLLLLLSGRALWGDPGPGQEDPPPGAAPLALDGSCREQLLQRIGLSILRLLRLDRAPQFPAEMAAQVRQTWARETVELLAPSNGGQHLNISSNQTLLIRRGSCTQISHHIMLADLGWQSWVLHPTSFLFTECLGCHCQRKEEEPPLAHWVRECASEPPNLQADRDSKQRRGCCRPRWTLLPFVFLREDGSLLVQPVRLRHDCSCRL